MIPPVANVIETLLQLLPLVPISLGDSQKGELLLRLLQAGLPPAVSLMATSFTDTHRITVLDSKMRTAEGKGNPSEAGGVMERTSSSRSSAPNQDQPIFSSRGVPGALREALLQAVQEVQQAMQALPKGSPIPFVLQTKIQALLSSIAQQTPSGEGGHPSKPPKESDPKLPLLRTKEGGGEIGKTTATAYHVVRALPHSETVHTELPANLTKTAKSALDSHSLSTPPAAFTKASGAESPYFPLPYVPGGTNAHRLQKKRGNDRKKDAQKEGESGLFPYYEEDAEEAPDG